jgi:hypothetical protein
MDLPLRRVLVRTAALAALAWPLASEAGTPDLSGTYWPLSGRTRIAGTARRGRRVLRFGDTSRTQIEAWFDSATTFHAHDAKGWDYAGACEAHGARPVRVKFTFDGASETEFDTMLASWLASVAEEGVSVDPRRSRLSAKIVGDRGTLRGKRRFRAVTDSAVAHGTWTLRASGHRQ